MVNIVNNIQTYMRTSTECQKKKQSFIIEIAQNDINSYNRLQ